MPMAKINQHPLIWRVGPLYPSICTFVQNLQINLHFLCLRRAEPRINPDVKLHMSRMNAVHLTEQEIGQIGHQA